VASPSVQFIGTQILFSDDATPLIAMDADCCCVWKLVECLDPAEFIYVTNDIDALGKGIGDAVKISGTCYEVVDYTGGNALAFSATFTEWYDECISCWCACPNDAACGDCESDYLVTIAGTSDAAYGFNIDCEITVTAPYVGVACTWFGEVTLYPGVYDVVVGATLTCGTNGDGDVVWDIDISAVPYPDGDEPDAEAGACVADDPNCPTEGAYTVTSGADGTVTVSVP